MAAWFERRHGSDESLQSLYDAVESAEELDLQEQVEFEAEWSEFWRLDAEGFVAWRRWDEEVEAAEPDENDIPVEELADDPAERPSMSQAVGLIEHLLGGHPMPGGEPLR